MNYAFCHDWYSIFKLNCEKYLVWHKYNWSFESFDQQRAVLAHADLSKSYWDRELRSTEQNWPWNFMRLN